MVVAVLMGVPGCNLVLFVLHLGGHGLVELGEALAEARLGCHRLGNAALDAAALAAREGLGGEVIDARVEAVVDEVAEEAHELLHLALLEALLKLSLLGVCECVHVFDWVVILRD